MDTVMNLNLSRRRFLTVLGMGSVVAVGASGCSQLIERQPNEDIVRLAAEYQKILDSGKPNRFQKPFLEAQLKELTKEWTRLCGQDSDGDTPASCTDIAQANEVTVAADFTAADLQHDLIEVASGVDKEKDKEAAPDGALLVGLAAALGGMTKAPQHTDITELTPASMTPELQAAYNNVHGAIFASGLAIAKDDGTNRELLRTTATALRGLRNAIAGAAKELGAELETPPAGFTPTEGEDMPSMLELTHSVVAALHYAAAQATAADDIRFAATWCCCIALQEIDLERAQKRNPLKTTVRG